MNIFQMDKEQEDKLVRHLTWVGRILMCFGFAFLLVGIYQLFHPEIVVHFNGKPTTSMSVKIGFVVFALVHITLSSMFAFLPKYLVRKVKKGLGVEDDINSSHEET